MKTSPKRCSFVTTISHPQSRDASLDFPLRRRTVVIDFEKWEMAMDENSKCRSMILSHLVRNGNLKKFVLGSY